MKPFIKNLTIAAALFTLALAAGCKKTPVNPFPESGAVEGWQKSTDTRVFKADDLWQYIDGDSDHYVQAGVVTTSTSDYKFQDSIDATVDVYTMSNSGGAHTIFDSDSAAGSQTISMGDAGRVYAQSLVFRKDKYLVRIISFTPGAGVQDALLALGRAVESRL